MKNSYNSLKNYIDSSLYEIDEELDLCTNKYIYPKNIKIFLKILFHLIQNKIKRNKKIKKSIILNLHKILNIKQQQKIEFINENAIFKYNLILEGKGRMKEAKVVASISNKN